MGFRNGSFAKVWEVSPVSDTSTKIRISTSRKNKETDEYIQDFSGFVLCCGTAAASKAAKLNNGDRIKLGDCDVTTRYDSEKKKEYVNYKLFSFEKEDGQPYNNASQGSASQNTNTHTVDDGEVNDKLPY